MPKTWIRWSSIPLMLNLDHPVCIYEGILYWWCCSKHTTSWLAIYLECSCLGSMHWNVSSVTLKLVSNSRRYSLRACLMKGQGPVLYGQKVGGPLSLDLLQRQHRLAASFNELKRHCYQQVLYKLSIVKM